MIEYCYHAETVRFALSMGLFLGAMLSYIICVLFFNLLQQIKNNRREKWMLTLDDEQLIGYYDLERDYEYFKKYGNDLLAEIIKETKR